MDNVKHKGQAQKDSQCQTTCQMSDKRKSQGKDSSTGEPGGQGDKDRGRNTTSSKAKSLQLGQSGNSGGQNRWTGEGTDDGTWTSAGTTPGETAGTQGWATLEDAAIDVRATLAAPTSAEGTAQPLASTAPTADEPEPETETAGTTTGSSAVAGAANAPQSGTETATAAESTTGTDTATTVANEPKPETDTATAAGAITTAGGATNASGHEHFRCRSHKTLRHIGQQIKLEPPQAT